MRYKLAPCSITGPATFESPRTRVSRPPPFAGPPPLTINPRSILNRTYFQEAVAGEHFKNRGGAAKIKIDLAIVTEDCVHIVCISEIHNNWAAQSEGARLICRILCILHFERERVMHIVASAGCRIKSPFGMDRSVVRTIVCLSAPGLFVI